MTEILVGAFVTSINLCYSPFWNHNRKEKLVKKLLLCDVNGTLFDDWSAVYFGTCAVLTHFYVTCPTISEYVREVGMRGDWIEFYSRRGIAVESHRRRMVEIFLDAFHAHAGRVQLMPGVHDAFERMREAGVQIQILTGASKELVEPLLKREGIFSMCEAFHYSVARKADVARSIRQHMRSIDAFMVGDIPADVLHAIDAGVLGIGFMNPDVPRDLFTHIERMHAYVYSFGGLADCILEY